MSSPLKIVIAEKGQQNFSAMTKALRFPFNYSFATAATTAELLRLLRSRSVDLLIVDLEFFPDSDPINFVIHLRDEFSKTFILPILPPEGYQLFSNLLELDICYFIHKPFDPLETVNAIRHAYGYIQQAETPFSTKNLSYPPFHGMVASSSVMRQLFTHITRIAADQLPAILIRGEPGTGKYLVARALHAQRGGSDDSFLHIKCSETSEQLLEQKLFEISDTDTYDRTATAHGKGSGSEVSTLFLHEIGELSPQLQKKLLRAVQLKSYTAPGKNRNISFPTVILTSTSCNLEQRVKEGRFRKDLYYRLNVNPIAIPPLRERREDIPRLVEAFSTRYLSKHSGKRPKFSPQARRAITNYPWRGNVRELKELVKALSVGIDNPRIRLKDLPSDFQNQQSATSNKNDGSFTPQKQGSSEKLDFNALIAELETQLILKALHFTGGNKKQAAEMLNLKRTTLLEKIKKKAIGGPWEKQQE
jgi:DNA-binding NtrC family response regulator